jgi:hypothetical protein
MILLEPVGWVEALYKELLVGWLIQPPVLS